MNSPEQLLSAIEDVLKQLEQLLRGYQKTVSDSNGLKSYAQIIYEYVCSSFAASQLTDSAVQVQSSIMEAAIKMHNKCRNLTSNNYLEVRTILKASSAYIFVCLGGKSARVYCTVLKLFSKCGEEFSEFFNNEMFAERCFKEVHKLWELIRDNSLCDELPPMEVQEVRVGVFHSMVGKLRMIMGKEHPDIKELKQYITPAMELSTSIPLKHKLLFVDTLLHIGSDVADIVDKRHEAVQLYSLGIELLEQNNVNMSDDDNEIHFGNMIQLKVKAYLAMIFTLCEMNEPEKAKPYVDLINQVESNDLNSVALSLFESPILYAKFFVSAKLQDIPATEQYLKELIKCTQTSFSTSLNAVRFVLDLTPDDESKTSRITDYFKILAIRFPKEPEFTTIRVVHLQYVMFQSDNQQIDQKSRDIASRILSDHLHEIHVLQGENFKLFRNLLLEHVRRMDARKQWNGIRSWIDVLIQLTEKDESEIGTNIGAMLVKVEASINLNLYTEAIDTAQRAMQRKVTSKALISLFHALLCSEDISAEEVIHRIIQSQEKYVANTTTASLAEDQLHQLLLCIGFVHYKRNAISSCRYHQISYLLIRVLLDKFTKVRPWRFDTDRVSEPQKIDTDSLQNTIDYERRFYEMTCIYVNRFFIELKLHLLRMVQSEKSSISESLTNGDDVLNATGMDIVDMFVDSGGDINKLRVLIKSLKTEFMEYFRKIVDNIVDNMEYTKDMFKLGNERELGWIMIACNVVINALFHLENTLILNAGEISEEDDEKLRSLLIAAKRNPDLTKYYYDNTSEHYEEAAILKFSVNLLYAEVNALMGKLYQTITPSMLKFLSSYSNDKNDFADIPEGATEGNVDVCRARCFIVAAGGYLDAVEVFKRHLVDSSLTNSKLWKELYGEVLESTSFMDTDDDTEIKHAADILEKIASKHHSLEQGSMSKYWKDKIGVAIEWCNEAKTALLPNIDFAGNNEKDLYSKSILLKIGCFCAMGDSGESDHFIRSMQSDLKDLQLQDIKVAVQIAKASNAFSIEAMRFLLQQSVENCKKYCFSKSTTDKETASKMEMETSADDHCECTKTIPNANNVSLPLTVLWMYRNLIEISASRRQAYDFFVEVENFLLSLFHSIHPTGFDTELEKEQKAEFLPQKQDLDQILATGHNYTCTLIELDQIPLAELFLLKILHLLPFASDTGYNWTARLKETYDCIAKRKDSLGGHGSVDYRVEELIQPFPAMLMHTMKRSQPTI